MKLSRLPKIALNMFVLHNAWVVGSGARYVSGKVNDRPRDLDIVVPPENWRRASMEIPVGTPSNSFGGFKVQAYYPDGTPVEIDIWSQDMGVLMSCSNYLIHGYHPTTRRGFQVNVEE